MLRNIADIYVSIFGKYIQFWRLVYICVIYPTWNVIFSNILFNKNIIKIADIYVITNGYLLQLIHILLCKNNIQYCIVSHYDFNNISIDKLQAINIAKIYVSRWFIFLTFTESIICGINIQHSMLAFHK